MEGFTTEYRTYFDKKGNPHIYVYSDTMNRYRIFDGKRNGKSIVVQAHTREEAVERYAETKRCYGVEPVFVYENEDGSFSVECSRIGKAMQERNNATDIDAESKVRIMLDTPDAIMQASVELACSSVNNAMRHAKGPLVEKCVKLYNKLKKAEITDYNAKDLADSAIVAILEELAIGGDDARERAISAGYSECNKWLRSQGYIDTAKSNFVSVHINSLPDGLELSTVTKGLARIVKDYSPTDTDGNILPAITDGDIVEREYMENTREELRNYIVAELCETLTAAELEIMPLLECGQSVRAIAKELGVTSSPIHRRVKRIAVKLADVMDDNGITHDMIMTATGERTRVKHETEHQMIVGTFSGMDRRDAIIPARPIAKMPNGMHDVILELFARTADEVRDEMTLDTMTANYPDSMDRLQTLYKLYPVTSYKPESDNRTGTYIDNSSPDAIARATEAEQAYKRKQEEREQARAQAQAKEEQEQAQKDRTIQNRLRLIKAREQAKKHRVLVDRTDFELWKSWSEEQRKAYTEYLEARTAE